VTLALGTVAAVATARTLRTMSMGDDTARGLGVRAQSGRAALVVLAVALAAVATAAAGPVAFVALVAPQVALRLVRSAGPPPATAALTGALLLVGSDLVARTVLPVELPVGIVTAALGAPFLIHLLLTAGRKVSR
jgi:iron complex transport system permease protein